MKLGSDDETAQVVLAAFEDPSARWKSIRQAAEDSGVTPETVLRALETHRNAIVRAPFQSKEGEDLFATRRHYRTTTSTLRRLLSAFRNRPV